MNTDASNVEDINIHQIKERLSMSCIASSWERSNIFRNRSFTLFKNDRDLRERFDSVAVSESINIIDDKLVIFGSPRDCFQHFTRFPLLRRPLVVNVPFGVVWWASAQCGSPPYLFAAHLTSSEVRSDFQIWFSPGFPMQSRQARSDTSHGIARPNSSSTLILL